MIFNRLLLLLSFLLPAGCVCESEDCDDDEAYYDGECMELDELQQEMVDEGGAENAE